MASLVAGLSVYRLVRTVWLAAGVLLATFSSLAALGNEPMQPSVLTSLLLAFLFAAAAFRSARPRLTAAAIGAIVAAICLIKLNVGGLAAIAVVFAWACSLDDKWRRFVLPVIAALMAAVPLLLALALLSQAWVIELAILVALSAAGVGVSCLLARPSGQPSGAAMWLIAGGAVVTAVTLGVALLQGTALGDLWNNFVVFSLRVPRLFVVPLRISVAYDAWAVVALVGALPLWRWRPSGSVAGLARVAVGFFAWLVLLLPPNTVFLLALPLSWVATRPPAGDSDNPADPYARVLLPALAVLESLQAFPAAGTELSLAELALIPVGALIINDGVRQLRAGGAVPNLVSWVPRAAVAFNVLITAAFALTAVNGYRTDSPLDLPGAESVRVPAAQAADLRALVVAIDSNCSSLITLPGMNSVQLWSDEGPPPPELRSEIWWLTLDSDRQSSLAQELQGRPRLCVVRNRSVVDFWALGRSTPDRPLIEFIDGSFTTAGTFGDYELLIRKPPG